MTNFFFDTSKEICDARITPYVQRGSFCNAYQELLQLLQLTRILVFRFRLGLRLLLGLGFLTPTHDLQLELLRGADGLVAWTRSDGFANRRL